MYDDGEQGHEAPAPVGHQNHHVTDEDVCPEKSLRAGLGWGRPSLSAPPAPAPWNPLHPRLSATGKQGASCGRPRHSWTWIVGAGGSYLNSTPSLGTSSLYNLEQSHFAALCLHSPSV